MKMSNISPCCDACFDLIARKSPSAAKLWLNLCDIQVLIGMFGYTGEDFHTLRILEKYGFVLTTDTPDFIYIKVLGERADPMGVYFCGGKCG